MNTTLTTLSFLSGFISSTKGFLRIDDKRLVFLKSQIIGYGSIV